MTVLITRPQPDADYFARKCRDAGRDTVIAPLMRVSFRNNWRAPDHIGALAFTSANGVRAFCAREGACEVPVFCVGEASANAARQEGFKSVLAAGGDVESLANLIMANRSLIEGDILHPAGAQRAGDLVAMLGSANIKAERVVAYEAMACEKLPEAAAKTLASGTPVDIPFFSPRTARLFLSLSSDAGLTNWLACHRAICLSEAVAAEARQAQWLDLAVVTERTTAAMVVFLKNHA